MKWFGVIMKHTLLKGAIFDLDGTLLDSMGVWEQIDIAFLGKRGLPVPSDYVAAITPMGFYTAAEYTIQRFQLADTPEQLMAEWNEMALYAYAHTIQCKSAVKEYLQHLQMQGIKMAVATASPEELCVPALQNNDLDHFFDAFTTLGEVSRGKGFPDIYWRTAEKLGLAPQECAVFEDISKGIQGAKSGGFITVGVYDVYSAYEQESIKSAAHYYINDFQEAFALPLFGRLTQTENLPK